MVVSLFIPDDIYVGDLLRCLQHAFLDGGKIQTIMPSKSLIEYVAAIPSSHVSYGMLFVDKYNHKKDEWNSFLLENFLDVEKIQVPSKKFYKKGVIIHGDMTDEAMIKASEIFAYIKGFLNIGAYVI